MQYPSNMQSFMDLIWKKCAKSGLWKIFSPILQVLVLKIPHLSRISLIAVYPFPQKSAMSEDLL